MKSRTRGCCQHETAMATRSKSSGTDVMPSMTTNLMAPKRVRTAAASRKISRREITANAMSCLIGTIQVGLTTRTCGFSCGTLNLSSTGYEISQFGGKRAAFIGTADELLSLDDPEQFCYKLEVADVDVDLSVSETPPDASDDPGSSASAASIESAGSDVRRKKSKRASKRRGSSLSQTARPSDGLEMSPRLTITEPISRDISAEHAKLIQLYVNPLESIPASVAAG